MRIDYKKIISNRDMRLRLLRLLGWIPDKIMLKIQYYIKFGRMLNLKNPQRFTEKLQWYKLNYRNPNMLQLVDKYDVRQYIEENGLGYILNDCYGIYETPEQIDFVKLPRQFVLKDTLGCGGDSVIIVKDKSQLNLDEVMLQLKKWVETPTHIPDGGREWPYYSGKQHRIIVEKYINADESQGGLVDFKFFCFNGKPCYLYVIADRTLGKGAGLGIYDLDYQRLPYLRSDESPLQREISKPNNYDEMLHIARSLSAGFPHVRVDLYNHEGRIIFGEMTFFDGSGYMRFDPDDFDYVMGEKFVLPPSRKTVEKS